MSLVLLIARRWVISGNDSYPCKSVNDWNYLNCQGLCGGLTSAGRHVPTRLLYHSPAGEGRENKMENQSWFEIRQFTEAKVKVCMHMSVWVKDLDLAVLDEHENNMYVKVKKVIPNPWHVNESLIELQKTSAVRLFCDFTGRHKGWQMFKFEDLIHRLNY